MPKCHKLDLITNSIDKYTQIWMKLATRIKHEKKITWFKFRCKCTSVLFPLIFSSLRIFVPFKYKSFALCEKKSMYVYNSYIFIFTSISENE